jgi:hypothetical protein
MLCYHVYFLIDFSGIQFHRTDPILAPHHTSTVMNFVEATANRVFEKSCHPIVISEVRSHKSK